MLLHFFSSLQTLLIAPPKSVARLPSYPFHAYRSSSGCWNRGRRASSSSSSVRAVEKESQFEIDREKAREALQKLDEQLLPPWLLFSEFLHSENPNFERQLMTGLRPEEMPEMSGSNLAFSVLGLLILTFFYNAVFYTFIKPSVNGNEAEYTTLRREPMKPDATKVSPSISDQD